MSGPDAFALIVGIGAYQDARIPRLDYTRADAEALGALLRRPEGMALPDDHVRVLIDREASLTAIKKAISGWLFKQAGAQSTVLLFFAGHGHVEADKAGEHRDGTAEYLLPWDADPDDLFASALSSADFDRLLRTIRAPRLVTFMDACHSGGVATPGARDVGVLHEPKRWLGEGEGRVVIAAAQANQRSWEDASLGHGIFTWHLLEALSGKADRNGDGVVSVSEVYQYLETHVPQSVRRLKNSLQEPSLCGTLARDILLTIDLRKRAEQEARRRQELLRQDDELRRTREALFKLHHQGELPTDAYTRAIEVSELPVEARSAGQRLLAKYVALLLAGHLSVEEFTRAARSQGATTVPPAGNRTASPAQRFCIRCGTRLQPGHRFCTGCGQAVR